MVKNFISVLICFSVLIVFTVKASSYEADVRVDITANTVTAAKSQAMAKAARDAITQVVQGISTEKSVTIFDELNDNQLQHFISGVMVLMEKSSDVRYIADLRVSVNEEVLKAYMAENDMPVVAVEEQEVLVIPLFEKEDGTLDLWGDGNMWRQAFLDKGKIQRGHLTIRVIDKNLGNISVVQTKRFYDMSDGEYNELAAFNRINNIYVIKYAVKDKKIYVKSFPTREVNELAVNKENLSQLVDLTLPLLKGEAKQETTAHVDHMEKTMFDVVYTYPQLAKWSELKKILEKNPQVDNLEIVSMGGGKVRFRFEFSGVIGKLQATLGENGYQMRNEGGYYVIY